MQAPDEEEVMKVGDRMASIPGTGVSVPSSQQDLYDVGTLTDGEIRIEIAALDTAIIVTSGDRAKTTRLERHRRALRDEQDRRDKNRSEHQPDDTGRPFPEVEQDRPPHH
jgi:hypothetical protein